MTIQPILIHPDPRLKKVVPAVEANSDSLQELIETMFETMYDAPGIGLAAPQIGAMTRVFVMDCAKGDDEPRPMALINPEITWASEELSDYEEGCLSIPDIYETVSRPKQVRMRFIDREFRPQELEFDNLDATCAQHELDHLNGKLFIDYLSQLKRTMITKKMKKFKRERSLMREA